MTPDEAKEILEDWLFDQADGDLGSRPIKLPAKDRIIYSVVDRDKKVMEQWTFIGLIKTAYGLQ